LIQDLQHCKEEVDHVRLVQQMPDLYSAFTLHTEEAAAARWELEARVLADESTGVIADTMAMTPEVVAWYEAIFFQVRDRLGARGYIAHQVIKWHGDSEPDLGQIWKLFAYRGGPVVLESLIHGLPPANRPQDVREVLRFIAEDATTTFELKGVVATHLLPVDESTAFKILRGYLTMRQLEARKKARRQVPSRAVDMTANIQAFLDGLPWTHKDANIGPEAGEPSPCLPNGSPLTEGSHLQVFGATAPPVCDRSR
jgi:hypothetical protein